MISRSFRQHAHEILEINSNRFRFGFNNLDLICTVDNLQQNQSPQLPGLDVQKEHFGSTGTTITQIVLIIKINFDNVFSLTNYSGDLENKCNLCNSEFSDVFLPGDKVSTSQNGVIRSMLICTHVSPLYFISSIQQ